MKLLNTRMSLGEKVRCYRKNTGCSQLDLEIEAGLASGTVCRIEKNIINPSKETILKIAEVLQLSPVETADLFTIDLSGVVMVEGKKIQFR